MRHPITIETPLETQSASGAVQQIWTTFFRCTAKIEPTGGTETEYTDQTLAQQPVKLTIRYVAGVTAKMRVKFNNNKYGIVGVDNWQMRNVWLTLICISKD